MASRSHLPEWKTLQQHQQDMQQCTLLDAFAEDAQRAQRFSVQAGQIFYDFSKQRLKAKTLDNLFALADACQLKEKISDLFSTKPVNQTENRPALHWLLRAEEGHIDDPQLLSYWQENQKTLQRIKAVSDDVFSGKVKGFSGKPFTDVVNLGIGGSDLGPAMVYQALASYQQQGIRCHYVANMCAHDIQQKLKDLNPHTTLFIVSSKSFTTLETLQNANTAKQWIVQNLGEQAVAEHFFAVSAKPELAIAWGVQKQWVFPFENWVGGRYSLWSAIGLSLSIGLGYSAFEQLLAGARNMDRHFLETDFSQNLPVLMGLIGIWNSNFWHWPQLAVIPYDHRLRRFPAFLQQLEMESNGKGCDNQGQLVDYVTAPTIWGEEGSNSQHSFFQLFHQSHVVAPIDFIAILKSGTGEQEHQDWLFTNCLAQSRALMTGQSLDGSMPNYQYMPGNKPSSTIVLPELTPLSLGELIALYEHKVYVQSVIWDIDAFDQWGVELGKKISTHLYQVLKGEQEAVFDGSTEQLLAMYKNAN